jgi:hypothetical protein
MIKIYNLTELKKAYEHLIDVPFKPLLLTLEQQKKLEQRGINPLRINQLRAEGHEAMKEQNRRLRL